MPGQPVSPLLARAWEQYFQQRGGQAPDAPAQALPVVILDDNSQGPYPPFRPFIAGGSVAALAANFSYAGVLNNDDPAKIKSVAVVDFIIVRNLTAQDDFQVAITSQSLFGLGGLSSSQDVYAEKEPANAGGPPLGNVQFGTNQSTTAIGIAQFPGGPITQGVLIPGPFILGPQQELLVRPVTLAEGIVAFFRGRYYPGS